MNDLKHKVALVAENLKIISHPGRLLILCSLLEGEKNVTEIEEYCQMGQSQTSQYLKKLETAELIKSSQDGKYHFYSLKDKKIKKLMKKLQELYC